MVIGDKIPVCPKILYWALVGFSRLDMD